MGNERFSHVELSEDELSFVLTLYNLNEISGFTIPATFDEAVSVMAGGSLLGRDFAVFTAGGQTIHPEIGALVTAGATYQRALGIRAMRHGTTEHIWVYLNDGQFVLFHSPRLNIKSFQRLSDVGEVLAKLQSLLNIASTNIPGNLPAAFSVSKGVLGQAEAILQREGQTASAAYLAGFGYPQGFIEHVMDEAKQLIIVNINLSEAARPIRAEVITHMVIEGVPTGWHLEEDPTNAEVLHIQPIDGAGILHLMAGWLTITHV
jgi:hypothetical protein